MHSPNFSRRQSLGMIAASATLGGAGGPATAAQPKPHVSVADFGARGDGEADDTKAFQAALDTGADIFVPAAARFYRLSATLATRRAGQAITGEGRGSFLVQHGAGTNATVLAVLHDDCSVAGLRFRPGPGGAPLYEGWGLAVSRAARCSVRECGFEGMRRGGILIHDSSDCVVRDNRFVDSVVRADGSVPQSEMGFDVLIDGNSSHNTVESNECLSGCGTGIGCQTVTEGKSQRGNRIRGNLIRGHPCYGVMVYLSGNAGRIDGVTVVDNAIEDISGSVRTDGKTYFYGAGIYIQTANDFLIKGNMVRATNTDRRLPPSGSGVPAAIAVSGRGNGAIVGNIIRECIDGITSIQATGPVTAGEGTAITGNVINDCARIGINLTDCAAAVVVGNRLAGGASAAHGIFVFRADPRARLSDFTISSNAVEQFHVGIEVIGDAIERAVINGNMVVGNQGYAIACGATTSIVTSNLVRGSGGIAIQGTARHGWCCENVVEADAGTMVSDAASGVTVRDNVVAGRRERSAGGQGPGAVDGKRWLTWPAGTALRELEAGYEGQTLSILAQGNVRLLSDALVVRDRKDRVIPDGDVVSFVYLNGRWRETG